MRALAPDPAAGLSDQEDEALGTVIRELATRWQIDVPLIEHSRAGDLRRLLRGYRGRA